MCSCLRIMHQSCQDCFYLTLMLSDVCLSFKIGRFVSIKNIVLYYCNVFFIKSQACLVERLFLCPRFISEQSATPDFLKSHLAKRNKQLWHCHACTRTNEICMKKKDLNVNTSVAHMPTIQSLSYRPPHPRPNTHAHVSQNLPRQGCLQIAPVLVAKRCVVTRCLAAFQVSARVGSLIGCCSTAPTWVSRRRGLFTAGTPWRKPPQVGNLPTVRQVTSGKLRLKLMQMCKWPKKSVAVFTMSFALQPAASLNTWLSKNTFHIKKNPCTKFKNGQSNFM